MASLVPAVAVRGSTGISVNLGPPSYESVPAFTKDESKQCKFMLFSPFGEYFAWLNGKSIQIASTSTWKVIVKIPRPKAYQIAFSRKGTYILSWEQFFVTDANPTGSPNLNIYKSDTGELVLSYIQKKQTNWAPLWTLDESHLVRLVHSELQFFQMPDFETIVQKVVVPNINSFSISPAEKNQFYVLCYVVGKSQQPSAGKLFQYPNIDLNVPVANKSFFQADNVDMLWHTKGNHVLLLVSSDVDKTNSSYYGKQSLHYMSTKGDTSLVVLAKNGPIYDVQWNPISIEFCVIYGNMPAKATLYNSKCEPIFEFGEVPRNTIHFNPQGNILLLGGFGNLNGNVETWDVKCRKLIAKCDALDTTLLHWSPSGEYFMTATTAPRLRTGNGFKIWHYSGALLYERPWNKQEELWEVLWQNFPLDTFKSPLISYKPVEGIQSSQPLPSKQLYVPPSQRGKEMSKPREEEVTKATLKLKKKREAKKAAKQVENLVSDSVKKTTPNGNSNHHVPKTEIPGTGSGGFNREDLDAETVKKVKRIKSNLNQIQKLKQQRKEGKQLEINQLSKIKKEDELVKELNALLIL